MSEVNSLTATLSRMALYTSISESPLFEYVRHELPICADHPNLLPESTTPKTVHPVSIGLFHDLDDCLCFDALF